MGVVVALGLDGLREIEESLSRFDMVTRATHDSVWDWDVVRQKAWWSPQQYEVFGYDPLTTIPSYEGWLRRIHPDDRERVIKHFEEVVASSATVWQASSASCAERAKMPAWA